MATIGQQLLAPEKEWETYVWSDSAITYNGTWIEAESNNPRDVTTKKYKDTSVVGDSLSFSFYGSKLRVIAYTNSNRSSSIQISIDGLIDNFSTYSDSVVEGVLVYESDDLDIGVHNVEMTMVGSGRFTFGAVDFRLAKRLILQNPTTNQHYSLAEKTLVPLPDSSSKNMILHGIEASKEIYLDEAFDKIKYISETSQVLGNGKKFEVPITARFKTMKVEDNY